MTAGNNTAFKLLLVEDNPGDADLARERLTSVPDYAFEITQVTHLRDAIKALETSSVDAVILDLNLPDSQGLETLKRLRKIHKEMAIIVLSGANDEALRRDVLREGAQEFMSKNESASHLVARSFLYALERHRFQEQHKQIERLVSANPDAVIVVDDENIVRFANSAALALFGKREADFVDAPLPYRIHEGAVSEIAFERAGGKRTAEMRAAPFEWNRKQALLASIRDTTEQKQLAEQFLQSQKMEAIGLLAGGVAHDFNNLLTVIINCATFLSDAMPEDDPRRRDVTQILGASDRAEGLVSQLLALTRKKSTQPRIVNLKETIQSLHGLLQRTLPANIEISVALQKDGWPVLADRGQIEQVLMNLSVNAKDAMTGGGQLGIALENITIEPATETRAAGDYVLLRISDTGCGIAPDILPRVFDPFFTTKGPGKGTGLGLATCYAIVRQAGGDITIESKQGAGTTISILLPRAHGVAVEESDNTLDKPEQLQGSETILVVEDEPAVLAMITELLRKNGYTVHAAANGEDALRLVEQQNGKIDLVLSDIVMPRMSGRELAKSFEVSRPDLKLLLMSAYAEDDPEDTASVPPRVIISKPFRPKTLTRKIREILDA